MENQSDNQLIEFFKRRKTVINQKLKRCRQFKEKQTPGLPYRQNTPKEQLVLEHVIQFKKQFHQHIQKNRQLFLYPKNQCDVYKFICTTIRPTKLGFLQLYNYQECAQRLSRFIQYQELDPPDQFPRCIPSPANVARWQKGDCFDMSILLCSLLIGVGYDAYCIFGIAPKQITTKNEALMDCDFLPNLRQPDQNEDIKEQFNLDENIFPKRITHSSFDKSVIQNEKKQKEELAAKALTIDDDEPDELTPDLYLGKRLHCWVMLRKGKRGVSQDLFIQPSTGKIYDIKNSPYLLVDSFFNHKNFFIHTQTKHKVDQIKFQMFNHMEWEFVMLQEDPFQPVNLKEEEGHDYQDQSLKAMDEDERLKIAAQALDMPPPWSPKIYIQKDRFITGTPLGQSTTFYIKTKVQKYSDYTQPDGLVLKYTLYEDYKKLRVKQFGYFYKHRSDKLQRLYRYPYEFKTVEYYGPGKLPHWKQVIEVDRRMRIITYYPNRNHDGLIKRIQKIGEQTTEYYQNRDDKVISRSVKFLKDKPQSVNTAKNYFYDDNHVNKVKILKMTQQWQRNKLLPAKQQIAKMSVDFEKQKVTAFYHMDEGEIQPIKKEYARDKILGYGKIDASQKKDDSLIQVEHQNLLSKEKQCYQTIRNQQGSILQQYKQMRFGTLTIDKTLYDKARQKFKQNKAKQDDDHGSGDADDYLKPFLEKRGLNPTEPVTSLQTAVQIKTDVMKKLKERIIARAKIIQERLQKQQNELKMLEDQYQKKQEDKNERELSDVKFKISILESRTSRYEAMAIQKFQAMDQKLNSDQRLAILKTEKK